MNPNFESGDIQENIFLELGSQKKIDRGMFRHYALFIPREIISSVQVIRMKEPPNKFRSQNCFIFFILFIFICSNGYAKPYLIGLIESYVTAVERGDEKQIGQLKEQISKSPAALDYLKSNYPEVYEKHLNQIGQTKEDSPKKIQVQQKDPSSQVTLSAKELWPNSKRARQFPVQKRRMNQEVVRHEPNTQRTDNRIIAGEFSNQNFPSNQKLIRQRQRQDRGGHGGYYEVSDGAIVLTISGVDSTQRQAVKEILEDETRMIESMDEIDFDQGVIVFEVNLDGNSEDFANTLDGRQFPSFQLELTNFSPTQIDCVLKKR